MNSKDFMNEMIKRGRELGDKPISKTIGRVKFEYGFSGFCKGHSMTDLFRPVGEPGKMQEVEQAMRAHTIKLGAQGSALFGLRYTVPAEYIISFEAQYGKERFVQAESEETDFIQIVDAMNELDIMPNEWIWCAYKTIESPSAIEKGDKGKYEVKSGDRAGDMVYPKIIIPIEKFANEAAARGAVGGTTTATADSQWSDTARANYKNLSVLKGMATQVGDWYAAMMAGTAFNSDPDTYPLPNPLTPPAVKAQLAQLYQVESADIDILMAMEVPF